MNKKTYIQTDEYTASLAELLLAKVDNHQLDLKELVTLMRTLIPSQEPERFYTSEQTADMLSISVDQLYRLRKSKKIHHREIESSIRYSKSDIEEFQASCRKE